MNIVIAAGGTGGHLFPAVALAREFLRQESRTTILFVGTVRGIEAKVLAHESLELAIVAARPVMGRGLRGTVSALLSLPLALWQSVKLLRKRRADLVIGVGGYTSPPVLVAAFLLGVRRVILEPNAYPGMANKMLGPLAHRVFLAFASAAGSFAPSKVRVVGTPIRRAFLDRILEGTADAGVDRGQTLLIFGGSQGARAINTAMIEALPHLTAMRTGLAVIHQTGEADLGRVEAAYEAAGFKAEVVPFLFDMPRALRSADLVVSRSGAMTVAELAVCGKGAILIPLPQAIYNHQALNAQVMESAGAAVVLPQPELTGLKLAQTIEMLLRDPDRLRVMGERSRTLGRSDSTEAIVQECLALVRRQA